MGTQWWRVPGHKNTAKAGETYHLWSTLRQTMNILENVRLSLSSTITTSGMSCGYQGWAPKWNLSESGSVATGPSWRSARAREQLPWGEAGSAAAEPPASSLGQGQHRCRFTLRTRFPASGDLHLHSLPLSSSRLSFCLTWTMIFFFPWQINSSDLTPKSPVVELYRCPITPFPNEILSKVVLNNDKSLYL